MGHVYILRSAAGKYYVGSCADLTERLLQHRDKRFNKSYTALSANSWELFLSIDNIAYEQSRKIEQHLKRMKSRVYIENLKKIQL